MKKVETLVIGAGPAGSACAIALLKAGKECMLVDKATFPRKKLCAGLFTAKSQGAAKELLGQEDYERCLAECKASEEAEMHYWRKNERLASCKLKDKIVLIFRPKFDNWLVQYYKSLGGKMIEGNGLKELDEKQKVVTLSDGTQIGYQYLVAADGANSRIRHILEPDEKRNGIFSLEANVPSADCPAEGVNIYLDVVPKTYAWSFAKGDTTCLGASRMPGVDIDLPKVFRQFLKDAGLKYADTIQLQGAIIPYDEKIRPQIRENIFLIGDAAGAIEPLTLEGIFYALQSGLDLAKAIVVADGGKVKPLFSFSISNGKFVQNHMLENKKFMDLFFKHASRHTEFLSHFYSEYIDHAPTKSPFKMVLMVIRKTIRVLLSRK